MRWPAFNFCTNRFPLIWLVFGAKPICVDSPSAAVCTAIRATKHRTCYRPHLRGLNWTRRRCRRSSFRTPHFCRRCAARDSALHGSRNRIGRLRSDIRLLQTTRRHPPAELPRERPLPLRPSLFPRPLPSLCRCALPASAGLPRRRATRAIRYSRVWAAILASTRRGSCCSLARARPLHSCTKNARRFRSRR